MAISHMKAEFSCDIEKVWDVVTSLQNYQWRSDLDHIEIINEETFKEYTKDGFVTTFHVTNMKPYNCWKFDMENDNMKGHWIGLFSEKDNKTEIDFTENVTVKKIILRPFVKGFLKKQQQTYVDDLRKELEK